MLLGKEQLNECMRRYCNVPLVFFFEIGIVDREDINRGLSRKECFEKCNEYLELKEFEEAWNDTDDDGSYLPEIMESWCYVSMPDE